MTHFLTLSIIPQIPTVVYTFLHYFFANFQNEKIKRPPWSKGAFIGSAKALIIIISQERGIALVGGAARLAHNASGLTRGDDASFILSADLRQIALIGQVFFIDLGPLGIGIGGAHVENVVILTKNVMRQGTRYVL